VSRGRATVFHPSLANDYTEWDLLSKQHSAAILSILSMQVHTM
jgi:hypothetical protein